MKKLLFNSSLPRSGSTLIQNILAQNPEFYCTPTSGTLELIYGARANFTNDVTFKAQDADLMRKGFQSFCNMGLHGFYDAVTDKPIILEKSRGWGIHYNLLEFVLNEKPKIICMVRDMKQIISSMEKKFRQSSEYDSGIVDHSKLFNTSTSKRVDHYLNTQPLGLAIERLQEIFRQGINENILFIRYEDLCHTPILELKRIYNYFELPYYQFHKFDNIEQFTQEDDSMYGIYGDHIIKPKLSLTDNDPVKILGIDICKWIDNNFKWYNDIFKYNL
jgi:sulfotransferase